MLRQLPPLRTASAPVPKARGGSGAQQNPRASMLHPSAPSAAIAGAAVATQNLARRTQGGSLNWTPELQEESGTSRINDAIKARWRHHHLVHVPLYTHRVGGAADILLGVSKVRCWR